MNNEEARLILRACRPGGQDTCDPLVAEALEQARRDPELQNWLARERVLDLRVQARVRTALTAPPELKASLLAMHRLARPAPLWRLRGWLAAAASFALLLGLAAVMLRPGNAARLDGFRNAMARYSLTERGHTDYEASRMERIQQWLQARGLETNFDLPARLRGRRAEGCRVVEWNGRKAALICFLIGGRDHVDFFVTDLENLPGLASGEPPQYTRVEGVMTAAWARGAKAYLLIGGGDKRILQKLLRES